jgi:hypothetical protein
MAVRNQVACRQESDFYPIKIYGRSLKKGLQPAKFIVKIFMSPAFGNSGQCPLATLLPIGIGTSSGNSIQLLRK